MLNKFIRAELRIRLAKKKSEQKKKYHDDSTQRLDHQFCTWSNYSLSCRSFCLSLPLSTFKNFFLCFLLPWSIQKTFKKTIFAKKSFSEKKKKKRKKLFIFFFSNLFFFRICFFVSIFFFFNKNLLNTFCFLFYCIHLLPTKKKIEKTLRSTSTFYVFIKRHKIKSCVKKKCFFLPSLNHCLSVFQPQLAYFHENKVFEEFSQKITETTFNFARGGANFVLKHFTSKRFLMFFENISNFFFFFFAQRALTERPLGFVVGTWWSPQWAAIIFSQNLLSKIVKNYVVFDIIFTKVKF